MLTLVGMYDSALSLLKAWVRKESSDEGADDVRPSDRLHLFLGIHNGAWAHLFELGRRGLAFQPVSEELGSYYFPSVCRIKRLP